MMSGDEGPRSASQFTDLDYKIEAMLQIEIEEN
jgi:hypothetical protein